MLFVFVGIAAVGCFCSALSAAQQHGTESACWFGCNALARPSCKFAAVGSCPALHVALP